MISIVHTNKLYADLEIPKATPLTHRPARTNVRKTYARATDSDYSRLERGDSVRTLESLPKYTKCQLRWLAKSIRTRKSRSRDFLSGIVLTISVGKPA